MGHGRQVTVPKLMRGKDFTFTVRSNARLSERLHRLSFRTPDAAAIIAPPAPRPGEHLMANVRHNAFLRSHLGRLLRVEGRDQLIICGVHAHLGVLLTAADAFMNDIQPFVVADAVADFSAEKHTMALRWAPGSRVACTTDTLLRDLLLQKATRNA
ncbi:isochorismatase family protein [Streptomyces sp. NPDC096176]|uniref:isochorismatase family protein n=1 Tax=Streptomyces sp. NPDC096176 TaxID=3366079 RepID=UPI003814D937